MHADGSGCATQGVVVVLFGGASFWSDDAAGERVREQDRLCEPPGLTPYCYVVAAVELVLGHDVALRD